MDTRASWLCHPADRERLMEMSQRVKKVRAATFILQAVALAGLAPWMGWWTFVPLGVAVVGFVIAERVMPRMQRPEYGYALAWLNAQAMIAASAAITGGPESPVTMWLAIPVVTLAARFTWRGIAAGVTITVAFLLACTIPVDPAAAAAAPQYVVAPFVVIVTVALLATALMNSELHHRSAAVIDPLTQMLNRKALSGRVAELGQQSEVSGLPVGVIVGDIDRFKSVNDELGHARGDAVLKDVAYLLRKHLRAFDLAYRLGGEEFLVLLPGADAEKAAEVAERLRRAVAEEPIAGVEITMSFGVAASSQGERFDFDPVFERADAALYEAKRAGRNRVAGAAAPVALAA